jgi:uncharacterized protein (TIGR02145 family)
MRKLLLLITMCMPAALMAQNGVEVSDVLVGDGSPGVVTFKVRWDKTAMPSPLWSDTVWVFVDYNDAETMKRLPLSTGATFTETSAPGVGRVQYVPGNNNGVRVIGNARIEGSFSATVRLLTAQTGVEGACAYSSNYPPVGTYVSASHILFTGTPPFKVTLRSDGGTANRTEGNSFVLPAGYAVQSFIDATEAPGILVPATYTLFATSACEGSGVTLALPGSHYGWRYQLHRDGTAVGAAVDGMGSALTFTDASATTSGVTHNYAVWTEANATLSQRALPASDVLAVTVKPSPSLVRSGGEASQIIDLSEAITPVIYTAPGATVISSGSSFPDGVSGIYSGGSYTISGTPTAGGAFGYTVTATEDGCSGAVSGTITVVAPPPGAASTRTWTVGTQIWSDALQKAQPGCIEVTHMGPNDAPEPPGPYYRASGLYSGSGYLYNWRSVNEYGAQLCPSPWRVPSKADFQTLDGELGGNGSNHEENSEWVADNYITRWGGVYGGFSSGDSITRPGMEARYWSSSRSNGTRTAYLLCFVSDGNVYSDSYGNQVHGNQVRCVR